MRVSVEDVDVQPAFQHKCAIRKKVGSCAPGLCFVRDFDSELRDAGAKGIAREGKLSNETVRVLLHGSQPLS